LNGGRLLVPICLQSLITSLTTIRRPPPKDDIEAKVAKLVEHPKLYRPGRVAGTREMIVRRNYVVVYAEDARAVSILRVLHASQQWPPAQV
jgi:plasmid stabilization system protein ParE